VTAPLPVGDHRSESPDLDAQRIAGHRLHLEGAAQEEGGRGGLNALGDGFGDEWHGNNGSTARVTGEGGG
jgi:hypothetical protein